MSDRFDAWPHEPTKIIEEALREYVGDGEGVDEAVLAAHDREVKAEALSAVVTPEAREHWEFTQSRRARHGYEGCVCTTCGLMARIESEARP